MSEAPKSMMQTIVDYYDGSIYEAADEIGVHYNTVDRLLNDDAASVQKRTLEKIVSCYNRITGDDVDPEEKITALEIGKAYEIRVPKSGSGTAKNLIRGVVKKEYRQFYQLDSDGKNVTILKADLINDRTTVTPIDEPVEEMDEPVDAEYVPAVEEIDELMDAEYVPAVDEIEEPEEVVAEEPDETTKMIEELTEGPVEEPTAEAPTIIGTTPAERLHSCLFIVELCDQKIAEAERAKKDKAAILPMMDQIYKEFRGGDIDGSNN